jgi:hypothetical protein
MAAARDPASASCPFARSRHGWDVIASDLARRGAGQALIRFSDRSLAGYIRVTAGHLLIPSRTPKPASVEVAPGLPASSSSSGKSSGRKRRDPGAHRQQGRIEFN